jgi:hypothetical protein
MQRTSCDLEDRLAVTDLIERISAERGLPFDASGRRQLLVDRRARRPRSRRVAPVLVASLTVLVASTVALYIRAGTSAPVAAPLDAALLGAASIGVPASPTPPSSAAVAPAPTAEAQPENTARPAQPPAPKRSSDGAQAASARGWTLIDRDEFTGVLGAKWIAYDGEGHDGDGRREPEAISVRNGALAIRGDEDGTTGGMAWSDDQQAGRWEMRARFPQGDAQYHPVLLLWPDEGDVDDGGIDFAGTTSASNSVSFVLHHGSDDRESAEKTVDVTQWHNYAVEVTPAGVIGYLDGQKWFESTDPDTLPDGPVRPAIQLDWFPEGDPPTPTEMLVDWMRVYE